MLAGEQDVELGRAERRGDLVLHDLRAHAVADDVRPLLQRFDAADLDAHGAVELQRAAAGRRLRVAEDDADLLAQLVDEDDGRARLGDGGGELAQRLRHQPRLQAGQRVAHLALDLGARDEGGDAVDDDDVDGVAADERVADLERLLAGVGLRDQQLGDIDAAGLGVVLVERVLDVDVGGDAAAALGGRDDVVGERGLAGAFRAVDLGDAAAGQAADAEREVEGERAGRDRPRP